ncbi:hypothetical protein H0266_11095 [Halobacillus locisalis]|uniref:SbsA Ig-like domain-containing protein n=1 Tax=Halobacillus locisalis TaxID=220753 RepID=A0A838CU41_9BACI|nr:hypothetical protein [Halobacillus locisalis]MBA2175441.1 hypothetical protein [Halobacillus locisalis]
MRTLCKVQLFLVVLFTAFFIGGQASSAEIDGEKVWEEENVVPEKMWTVTFNTPVSMESANQYIYVEESSGEELPIELFSLKDGKQVIVFVEEWGLYKVDEKYTLVVDQQLTFENKQQLQTTIQKPFTIEDAVERYQLVESERFIDEQGTDHEITLLHRNRELPEVIEEEGDPLSLYQLKVRSGDQHAYYVDDLFGEKNWSLSPQSNVSDFVNVVSPDRGLLEIHEGKYNTDSHFFYLKKGKITPTVFETSEGNIRDSLQFIGGESLVPQSNGTYESTTYDVEQDAFVTKLWRLNENTDTFEFIDQKLTPSQVKNLVQSRLDQIEEIVYEDINPLLHEKRDFNRIESSLTSYMTTDYIEKLESAYPNLCYECDVSLYNHNEWDTLSELIVHDYDEVTIETATFGGGPTSGGFNTYTLKQIDGMWKLSSQSFVPYGQEKGGLNLNKKEAVEIIQRSYSLMAYDSVHVTNIVEENFNEPGMQTSNRLLYTIELVHEAVVQRYEVDNYTGAHRFIGNF